MVKLNQSLEGGEKIPAAQTAPRVPSFLLKAAGLHTAPVCSLIL